MIPDIHQLPPVRVVIITLIAGLLGIALFAAISAAVIDTGPVLDLDADIAQAIHDAGQTPAKDFFEAFTLLGNEGAWIITIGVGLILIARRRWAHLLAWALALTGGQLLNQTLKAWFARPRPAFPGWTQTETTFGYPSGHTMTAMLAYGMLAVFAWHMARSPRARALIVTLAGAMIILLGLSRIAINAHFLSDVIGGLIGGGIWLATCAVVFVIMRRAEPANAT